MLVMENAEEVMQILERFTKLKQKDIPKELEEYLSYVAKTGDTVYTWANIKYLFREKLIHVIKDFHDSTSSVDDLPQYPNVDPFNYETMKSALLERLELFNSAPFTVQRLCELLTDPKKQYSRIDKYMRALEKNILVVSTIEPGRKQAESENGDSLDSVVNGDLSLDVNIDVEIDIANEAFFNMQHQIRNNATSSTNNIHSNTPAEDEDVEMPSAKKPKLDLELTAVTVKSTADLPANADTIIPSSEIPKQKSDSENESVSDSSDSEESKQEIKKDKQIEHVTLITNTTECESTAEVKLNENIPIIIKKKDEKIEENKSVESSSLNSESISKIEITDSADFAELLKAVLPDAKPDIHKVVAETEDINPTDAKDEDMLITVCDTSKTNSNDKIEEMTADPIVTDEVTKDADELIKDETEATLKESAAADEEFEEEIEKIETAGVPAKQTKLVEKLPEAVKEIIETLEPDIVQTPKIEELAALVPHSVTEPPADELKFADKISEDGTDMTPKEDDKITVPIEIEDIAAITPTDIIIEPIETDSSICTPAETEKQPEPVIPLDVEILIADSVSETSKEDSIPDQPMEDSAVDTPMSSANDNDSASATEINEVVMQPAETAMATDGELIVKTDDKSELAGMDVDDNSQEEAMDQ